MIATVFHVYSIINHSLSITNTSIIKIKRRRKNTINKSHAIVILIQSSIH